jgi:dTDP-4-dehydrorhamnose reductase
MTIVVLGAGGQLGSEFCRRLGPAAIGLSRRDLDITRVDDVRRKLTELAPRVVINSAAYTQVDRAQDEPEQCQAVNALAVGRLAEDCQQLNAVLVHISTDYVFGADRDRRRPYREDDEPGPLSVYGRTKLEGERLAANCQRHLVLRTCGLYGCGGKMPASNFVETILQRAREGKEIRVVDDQSCTPTCTRDVVRAALRLLDASAIGVFNVVNGGSTTWREFARQIVRLAGLAATVTPIATKDFPRPAERPAYSVLDTGKYEAVTSDALPPWRHALADYLSSRADGGG